MVATGVPQVGQTRPSDPTVRPDRRPTVGRPWRATRPAPGTIAGVGRLYVAVMPDGSATTITDATDLDAVAVSLVRDGVAVVPGVLTPAEAADGLKRLWAASRESERRGVAAHVVGLDPNASNVRVFNLIDLDPLFGELIAHPVADAVVSGVLGREYIVSNFTANIARPGSASMVVHSDQAAVMPEPWVVPQTVNVIWCLTDVRAANRAPLDIPRGPP